MEFADDDIVLKDISLLRERGLLAFMFPDNGSDVSERPGRLRQAYARSWEKVHDFLFDPATNWQVQDTPLGKLTAFFSRLCDMEESKELEPYAQLAYLGLWDEDGSEGSAVHSTLYDDVPKGAYAVDSIRAELEKIASEIEFSETPEHIAKFTMNLAMTIHLTRTTMGEDSTPNRFDVETGYMDHLLKLAS